MIDGMLDFNDYKMNLDFCEVEPNQLFINEDTLNNSFESINLDLQIPIVGQCKFYLWFSV